eukprot:CAMPEP_0178936798 /NCGR_PEP_ID=MMETSP0786-20121207/25386_1 /TAXON_ID=186022 /ORGANISM="Thalassionema frauenfeldii, Strain CCMP 1798" /LENGTH=389 /DNA_ID=CAMNT_0020615267 /DNA_START=175 /DNA_END=1344 /DNA_ORIENTATION=-
MSKKTNATKYKKAPQAPRRFKSAYMFFSTAKHKEIREELGEKGVTEKTTNIAKMVSQAWKNLSKDEKEKWEEMARKDKLRYEVEKSLYTGPWKVPFTKRSQKDPNAPKRPMSAFLGYSHSRRAEVKAKNPEKNNAEISRVLAKMWKNESEEEKKEYIEEEYKLRKKYLNDIAVWREKAEKELREQREHREEFAMKTVEARGSLDSEYEARSGFYEKDGQPSFPAFGYGGHYPGPEASQYYGETTLPGPPSQGNQGGYSNYYPPPGHQLPYEQAPRGPSEAYHAHVDAGYYSNPNYGYYAGYGGSFLFDDLLEYPQHAQSHMAGGYYDRPSYPPPHEDYSHGHRSQDYPPAEYPNHNVEESSEPPTTSALDQKESQYHSYHYEHESGERK